MFCRLGTWHEMPVPNYTEFSHRACHGQRNFSFELEFNEHPNLTTIIISQHTNTWHIFNSTQKRRFFFFFCEIRFEENVLQVPNVDFGVRRAHCTFLLATSKIFTFWNVTLSVCEMTVVKHLLPFYPFSFLCFACALCIAFVLHLPLCFSPSFIEPK